MSVTDQPEVPVAQTTDHGPRTTDPPRIVSLIASATEVVCALGFEDRLVGRSHECDYPPSVKRLPACSEPKIDVEAGSRQIDDQVRAVVEQALSVYRVDADMLERLQPTVIVTQTHCEVCAVSLKDVEQALCRTVSSRPKIVSLAPNGLDDLWTSFRQVAAALDAPERAEPLIARLQQRLAELAERTTRLPERPTVGCIEWIDPLMSAGNWVPELVEIAGGADLFGTAGRHSPWMSWDDLAAKDPDVVAVMPCGFDIPRTRRELPALTSRPEWPGLTAVRQGRAYLTDGNQYFNRPGPRLVESAEILAEILHPGQFDFGHEGTGWVRLPRTW